MFSANWNKQHSVSWQWIVVIVGVFRPFVDTEQNYRMYLNKIPRCVYLLIYGIDSINPYPTAFPYGNGMVLHFYQQQESSTTKPVHKVIKKGLKTYV